ncbi:MAG: hypothetical protein ACLGHU_06895 [Alphaproteobacteria bacterium]
MRLTAFRPPGAPAALAAALLLAPSSAALAQADPFGALYNPPPGAAQAKEASSGRTGSTSVGGAVGRSYANAQASGQVSLAQLDMMPDIAPPLPVALQGHATRYLANRPRIVIPGYTLAFVQGASASAFGGGAGLDTNQRRTQIATRLVGLTDAMAQDLADSAHADLVAQLEAAGFEVIDPAAFQASEQMRGLSRYDGPVGGQGIIDSRATKAWVAYGPRSSRGTPSRPAWALWRPLARSCDLAAPAATWTPSSSPPGCWSTISTWRAPAAAPIAARPRWRLI